MYHYLHSILLIHLFGFLKFLFHLLLKFKNKKIKIIVGITVVSSVLIGGYYLYNKESNTAQSEMQKSDYIKAKNVKFTFI